jgi:hypothetical protein
MVLAVNTLQVAVIEKNITYPFSAADDRFFAVMVHDGANVVIVVDAAISVGV